MGCIWSKRHANSQQSNYDYTTVPSSPPDPISSGFSQPTPNYTTILFPNDSISCTPNPTPNEYYPQLQYPITYYYVPEPINISPTDSGQYNYYNI